MIDEKPKPPVESRDEIVGISTVKNECDIVELFVRYNLRFLDKLFLIDNSSTDNTRAILLQLKNEGLPIMLFEDRALGHWQSERTTFFSREIYKRYHPKYICPLDADEFILAESKRMLLEKLDLMPIDTYGIIPWRTYVIRNEDDRDEQNIFLKMQYRRVNEKPPYYKVILNDGFFMDEKNMVSQGSHEVLSKDKKRISHRVLEDIYLAHFPVRSKNQIVIKSIMGTLAYLIKNIHNMKIRQGYQKLDFYDRIIGKSGLNGINIETESKYYAQDRRQKIELIKDPILSTCLPIYTPIEQDPLIFVTKMFEKYIYESYDMTKSRIENYDLSFKKLEDFEIKAENIKK